MGIRAGDLLAEALRAHVAALAAAEADLVEGGPEAVHDARVAVRRLRAVLGEFPRLVDDDVARDLRRRLRAWGRMLGEARDLEVMLGMLDGAEVDEPRRALARERWAPRLEAARTAALDHLGSAEHLRLRADLAAAAAHPPFTGKGRHPWRNELPRGARRASRRVERREQRAQQVDASERDTAQHAVRKAVRRARYAAEVVALGSGMHADRAAEAAERYAQQQDTLGAAHDAAVLRQALEALDAPPGA
jgi:CHAD domain-containing protein